MTTPSSILTAVLADLAAEGAELDALVSAPGVDFTTPTPAAGWTVAHQIGHLTWTDELTVLTCRDPEGFLAARSAIVDDLQASIEAGAAVAAGWSTSEVVDRWRAGRAAVLEVLAGVPSGTRLPFLGPPMGGGTMASARIMETWAHGLDIADALGVHLAPTDRLRHVADLGVRTRDHSFATHRLPVPDQPFRVELKAPSGRVWEWGPQDADERVSGTGLDFCLLVTQRRHRFDLGLSAVGAAADRWLLIAQAFAGPPGSGRTPAGCRPG
jgi:uncharacterized protein (TIGR03084 family)